MTQFRILGQLELEADGGGVELAAHPRRILLALLLRANQVVPTEVLVDDVWGETPPKHAVTSLHNGLTTLRKVLGDAIVTRAPGYILRVERDQVDAFRFEDLLALARGQEGEGRAATLREALGLWRGSPLVDVMYDAFASQAVLRLEDLRVVAREELAEAELELGAHDVLVPELERLVAEVPLRERAWGLLMLALYRSGRTRPALRDRLQQVARGTGLAAEAIATSSQVWPPPLIGIGTTRTGGRRQKDATEAFYAAKGQ